MSVKQSPVQNLGQSLGQRFGWLLFALYVVATAVIPLGLLGGLKGLYIGAAIGVGTLIFLRFTGERHLTKRLRVEPLSAAENPRIHSILAEYARRLAIPTPRVGTIESRAVNGLVFGFSQSKTTIVLTRGALDSLDREDMSAFLARLIVFSAQGTVQNSTWLARFLSLIDFFSNPRRTRPSSHSRRYYSFRTLFRQALLYPLTLFPVLVLREQNSSREGDALALRLSGKIRELAEVYRRMEALSERFPLHVPVSTRHLFLLPPPTPDPLARVFFEAEPLKGRARAIENLERVVSPA